MHAVFAKYLIFSKCLQHSKYIINTHGHSTNVFSPLLDIRRTSSINVWRVMHVWRQFEVTISIIKLLLIYKYSEIFGIFWKIVFKMFFNFNFELLFIYFHIFFKCYTNILVKFDLNFINTVL